MASGSPLRKSRAPPWESPAKTTEWAAQLIRACIPPAGVKVVVLCKAYDRCPTVVKACHEQPLPGASTLQSHRSLCKPGVTLHAGRYGRHLCRRRRTDTLALAKPYGSVRYRFVDAGWVAVSTLGPRHVVFARPGTANTILGLVTDSPQLSAADVIRTYAKRWTMEPQNLLGDDLITSLQEDDPDQPVIEELARPRVACTAQKSVNMSMMT
jgi:hypothetical protein